MSVTNRDRQRIRLIGSQRIFQCQDRLNHMFNLFFISATATDDRLLDLSRRIFEQPGTAAKCAANSSGTGVSEFQRAVGISMHEYLLDGHMARLVLLNQFTDPAKYTFQPRIEGLLRNPDTATANIPGDSTITFHNAVAGHPRARVNTENPH